MSSEETTTITNKTKMPLAMVASVVVFCCTLVYQGMVILARMDEYHSDCLKLYEKSWHVNDMTEYNHQARGLVTNNLLPDISEVLRVSRASKQ